MHFLSTFWLNSFFPYFFCLSVHQPVHIQQNSAGKKKVTWGNIIFELAIHNKEFNICPVFTDIVPRCHWMLNHMTKRKVVYRSLYSTSLNLLLHSYTMIATQPPSPPICVYSAVLSVSCFPCKHVLWVLCHPMIGTGLEKCTLWSILTFQRCSSCHITWVIFAPMWSEGIVAQCVPTMISLHIVGQQCVPSVGTKGSYCCTTMTSSHTGCLLNRKIVDRHGQYQKEFFVHATMWRMHKNVKHMGWGYKKMIL